MMINLFFLLLATLVQAGEKNYDWRIGYHGGEIDGPHWVTMDLYEYDMSDEHVVYSYKVHYEVTERISAVSVAIPDSKVPAIVLVHADQVQVIKPIPAPPQKYKWTAEIIPLALDVTTVFQEDQLGTGKIFWGISRDGDSKESINLHRFEFDNRFKFDVPLSLQQRVIRLSSLVPSVDLRQIEMFRSGDSFKEERVAMRFVDHVVILEIERHSVRILGTFLIKQGTRRDAVGAFFYNALHWSDVKIAVERDKSFSEVDPVVEVKLEWTPPAHSVEVPTPTVREPETATLAPQPKSFAQEVVYCSLAIIKALGPFKQGRDLAPPKQPDVVDEHGEFDAMAAFFGQKP